MSTLRRRITWAFAGVALTVAVVFGISTTVFLYTVEDEFFNALLGEEAALLENARVPSDTSPWGVPRHAWMSVHESARSMPADLSAQVSAEPQRREFRGASGRHYHLRRLRPVSAVDSTSPRWLVAEVSSRLVVRPMRVELLRKWIVVEVLILLLAIVVGLRVAGRIARPLSTLADSVRELDPAREGALRIPANAEAEVAVVAQAIDDLRARVHAMVRREQTFTRDVSHELRTPLSVIRSTVAQSLHDAGLSPSSRRMLTFAGQSAEQLERTVTSLLALARHETIIPRAVPVSVLPVLEQVVLEQAPTVHGRDVTIAIEVAPDATLPVPDAVLHILLSNLVGNAFAHTASGIVRVSFVQGHLIVRNPIEVDDARDLEAGGVRALAAPGVKREESPGLGLGLDIAMRLCARAQLTLSWRVDDGAFVVAMGRMPAAES